MSILGPVSTDVMYMCKGTASTLAVLYREQRLKNNPILCLAESITAGATFENAEAYWASMSPNLNPDAPGLISIPLSTIPELLEWTPDWGRWVSCGAGSNLILGMLMPPDDTRPAARFYFSSISEAGLNVLKQHLSIESVADSTALEQLGGSAGFSERLRRYQLANSSANSDLLNQFLEGRASSTNVTASHIFDTKGACLVCGATGNKDNVMTTIGTQEGAETLVVTLCVDHEEEASGTYLIKFLADKFGFELPIRIQEVSSDDVLKWIESALISLDCSDFVTDRSKCQMTGTRSSGFKVILKCEGHTIKPRYAYMVMPPKGEKNIARIDDAHHHPEQRFLWDHVHIGLPKDNATVAPSYTFGQPNFDLPAIRAELERAEAAWAI